MTRRRHGLGWGSPFSDPHDADEVQVEEVSDPDPTVNFPQWSRSLLLLLDYAIIEGLQHRQHTFVHFLKLAEAELTKVVSGSELNDVDQADGEDPSKSKAH